MSMHFDRPHAVNGVNETNGANHTNGINSKDGINGYIPKSFSLETTENDAVNHPCVIGMACRVPGASSPSRLWDNLVNQVDSQGKMPSNRFNVDTFHHPDGTHKGTTNAKYGYFLEQDIGSFDAGFFNISGKEAEAMDPQQRLLLEVVYEALEDAGITLDEIQGSQTSVYCGCFTNDYNAMTTKDLEYYPKYTVTGTGNSILSNRISYFYNLHGPSATIDTACSSSLVCFHMGAQSLRNAEADLSIVIGSALHFDPNIFITMTDLGMLSTDGRCRHGDAAGSGYVRGEGITAMIIKRQREAEKDGDSIRAIVRGTGVNHDGRKQGITLPSAQAQAALIRSTYQKAGLDPVETSYVECHGTGTKAGDPRELKAIGDIFSPGREGNLYVGSIKTNIGHLEGASGLAGLIKATLALERKIIPPNMHFNKPNPEVDFENWKIRIPTAALEWKIPTNTPRRASINSFGYGGTNAHVILEEYLPRCKPLAITNIPMETAVNTTKRPYLVPVTSHHEKAGKAMANKLADFLRSNPDITVADFALALSQRRSLHRFRSFAVGATINDVSTGLLEASPAAQWQSKLDTTPRLGFVFTGQGAQWFAMGRSLIEQSPLFAQTLQRCDRILQSLPQDPAPWSIVEELLRGKDDSRLDQTRFSQPICTALQLALLEVLAQWGITPAAVVGHSSGELAATYASGLLSFENALVAAYYRGVHMGSGAVAPDSIPGAMMAVGMSEAEVATDLKPYAGRIAVAAMNSPSSFTLSGDEDAIVELQGALVSRKVFARRLQVAQAFHSHHMHPLAPGYEKALREYPGFKANKTPTALMVSSVTGRHADPMTMGPAYFAANMTGMVKFSDALTGIVLDDEDQLNIDALVEIGPHPALKGPSNQTLDQLKVKIPYIGTLDRKQDAFESLLITAGKLFSLGYPVSLRNVNANYFVDPQSGEVVREDNPITKIKLPSYAWDHDRYWGETRVIREHRQRPFRHSILGALVPGSLAKRPRWRNFLRISEIPWLVDHSIDGKVIFPGAGYINLAIEAATRLSDCVGNIREISLTDISVKSALVVTDKDMGTEIITELFPSAESAKTASSWNQFVIFSIDESGTQREHCTGLVHVEQGKPEAIHRYQTAISEAQIRQQSFRSEPCQQYYHRLHSMGLQYGKAFQLTSGSVDSGRGISTVPLTWKPELFSQNENDISILHPALLDAAFHPVFAAIEGRLGRNIKEPFVPTFVKSLRVSGLLDIRKASASGYEAQVLVKTEMSGPRTAISELHIKDTEGHLLVDIDGLELTSLGSNSADNTKRSLFFGTEWQQMFTSLSFSSPGLSANYDLGKLVELYTHQFPNTKILHFSPSISSTEDILSHLRGRNGERRSFGNFIISPTGTITSEYESTIEHWKGLVGIEKNINDEKFDLVISSTIPKSSTYDRVTDNGHLLVAGPIDRPDRFQSVFSSSLAQVWRKDSASKDISNEALTIVMPANPSTQTEEFATAIESLKKFDVTRRDFRSLANASCPPDTNIIILASLDINYFFDAGASGYEELHAAQAILTRNSRNIVWVTRGGLKDVTSPEQAIVLGLARSARSENPDLRLVVFDISPSSKRTLSAKLASEVLNRSVEENEIAERDGVLYIPRIVAKDELNAKIANGIGSEATLQPLYQPNRPLQLRIDRPGLLETLVFSDDLDIANEPLNPDELEIEVKASAINFRDIAASMGIIDDFKLGDECAGIILRKGSNISDSFAVGDHVVAWRPGQGAHRTVVRNPASLCYKLGPMPFSVAASIPLVITTAHYSLVDTARLQPGETVLIHAAAGGVGQMAVQIAQNIGATVIATVGSQSKRELLKSRYGLKDSHIFSSRDASFVEGLYRLTNGRGVDVALNSLAGPLLLATWASLAPFGRFVEIGKRDIHQNSRIPMDPYRNNVSFASVDMITMFERNKQLGAKVFQECCALVHDGKVQPPEPITELSYAQTQKGFRMLQTGSTFGKIVLVPGANDKVLVEPSKFTRSQLFSANKIYLLVGGLGGLGRRLSEWLFQRGARHLAFLARSGSDRPNARSTVEWLQQRGVKTTIFKGDVTDAAFVQSSIKKLGDSLAGVIQAAMVLQDSPLDKMGHLQWQRCMDPKVHGAFNLHKATENAPLDFFICFSSVSAILGSKGQANYSAANNYLDALCCYRRSIGLAGTTMNVGMIVGIGAVSEDAKLQTIMERIGYDAVNEEELFAQIEAAVSSEKLAAIDARGRDSHQTITGINLRRPDYYWSAEPRFRNLYANHDFSGSGSGGGAKKTVMAQLQEAPDDAARVEILTTRFFERIAAILSVDQASLQSNRSLADYGLDSIVAIEIRQWFFKNVNVDLPMFDILGSNSIRSLIEKLSGMIVLTSTPVTKTANEDYNQSTNDSVVTQATLPERPGLSLETGRDINIPMSTFQQRLWFAHNMAEDPSFLNLSTIFDIRGDPKPEIIRQALKELKRRNAILRTAYFEGDEFSQQTVIDDCTVDLSVEDFSSSVNPEAELHRLVTALKEQKLDIESGDVMKTSLVRLGKNDHALILILHHICIDRGSSQSFLEQFTGLYESLLRGSNIDAVAQPTVSYAEFSLWHNALLGSKEMDSSIEFWKATYKEKPSAMKLLPFAQSERPGINDYKRSIQRATLKKTLQSRMRRICARLGITPAQFLVAAFRTFLFRYVPEDDMTIHLVDGNRSHPAVNNTLGFFVNIIPIRCATDNSGSFESVLQQIKDLIMASLPHSELPFDYIVEAVGAERTPAHFPLGQVIVNYQIHGTMPTYSAGDFEIHAMRGEDIPTACELGLEALEDPIEGLKLRLEYSNTLYCSSDMDRFLDNFVTFMASAIRDHRQNVSEINMVGPRELEFLKNNMFNMGFTKNHWKDQSVGDRILAVARQHPHAVAIRSSNSEEQLSYLELVAKASGIAAAIQHANIAPGDNVGILSNPGAEAISAMVGVLIAGCGFVSLDPDFAADRLKFMISDSSLSIVLAGDGFYNTARSIVQKPEAKENPQVLSISSIPVSGCVVDTVVSNRQDSPFYTIYTSGSTGTPKGVVLTQSNTQAMLSTLHHDYQFDTKDRFLHQSSICFDLSIVQIFSALTAGARVCVASSTIRKDPIGLAAFMEQSQVTVTYFTPTHFALLMEHAEQRLKHIRHYRVAYFAGERLPVRVAKAFYDLGTPATVYNTWSPSELVVQTTIQQVQYPSEKATNIPIGFPMANMRHYIMDANANPLPMGVVGEIVVGGPQVGLGYINRPEVNDRAFLSDPFWTNDKEHPGWGRMFRTGDRGRFLPSGNLEFHGRIAGDKQVKLRGYRIDLGEVENQIFVEATKDKGGPGIIDLAVIARPINLHPDDGIESTGDDRQLIAFVVPKRKLNAQQKQDFAIKCNEYGSQHLNSYMLPSAYQFFDSLPVTIGGKVDLQKLTKCDLDLTFPIASSAAEQDISTDVHDDCKDLKVTISIVIDGFRNILKLSQDHDVSPDDSFFALGGNSILLVRLQGRLKRTLRRPVALNAMFKTPTPRSIAHLMTPGSANGSTSDADSAAVIIDWDEETRLDQELQPAASSVHIPVSDVSSVLITGADSFIGIHMIATILRDSNISKIYALGSQTQLKYSHIYTAFDHYKLSNLLPNSDEIADRIICVPGTLSMPHFGLSPLDFRHLGRNIQAIYHLGGYVTLLRDYGALRAANVAPVRDVIKLASLGKARTHIHHLSTWSVPHLQTWSTSQRSVANKTISGEESAMHFTPETDDRFGYFKSRWAAEAIMEKAAERGFPVAIYRASAVTASRATGVPEPKDDFIRTMILSMIYTEAIPSLPERDEPFVVDFVPVDYLTNSLHILATNELDGQTQAREGVSFYHLNNPSALPISRLAGILADVKSRPGLKGKTLPVSEWFEAVARLDDTPNAELRWTVLKEYFNLGHNMFTLESKKTQAALASLGLEPCPPVDGQYLRNMIEGEKLRVD